MRFRRVRHYQHEAQNSCCGVEGKSPIEVRKLSKKPNHGAQQADRNFFINECCPLSCFPMEGHSLINGKTFLPPLDDSHFRRSILGLEIPGFPFSLGSGWDGIINLLTLEAVNMPLPGHLNSGNSSGAFIAEGGNPKHPGLPRPRGRCPSAPINWTENPTDPLMLPGHGRAYPVMLSESYY
nr:hypothetical protein Iba_chr04bCG17600 [Ipomoea batatas]